MNTCIIGDIHGSFHSFTALLRRIEGRVDTIVLLGDYVDRGPFSKEVVDAIIALQQRHPRVIALMGNHDYMFKQFLNKRNTPLFLQVGGKQTLRSYGILNEAGGQNLTTTIPPEHIVFFNNLPLLWEDQHAIYVHAGLQPGLHLSRQTPNWCLWAREQFISSSFDFGKPVVFGHTVFSAPHVTSNKIGIDTGAVYGGRLTALILPDMEFISIPGEQAHPYPKESYQGKLN